MKNRNIFILLIIIITASVGSYFYMQTRAEVERYYKDTKILSTYGIVSSYDLKKTGNISNLEALKIIALVRGYDSEDPFPGPDFLLSFETIGISESEKAMLSSLYNTSGNPVILPQELENLKLNEPLKEYEALIYLTRMAGDTFGCTDSPDELSYNTKKETYESAFKKNLVNDTSTRNSDNLISRQQFYYLLVKAINVYFYIGEYSGLHLCNYGVYLADKAGIETENAAPVSIMCDTMPVYHDDMSLSFDFNNFDYRWKNVQIKVSTKENVPLEDSIYSAYNAPASFSNQHLLSMYLNSYPEMPAYLEGIYRAYYTNGLLMAYAPFKMNMDKISVIVEGEPLNGSCIVTKDNDDSENIESVTLTENSFIENEWYYLDTYGYEDGIYKKINTDAFYAEKSGSTTSPYNIRSYEHTISIDKVYIRHLKITGNPENGFVIHITPLAEKPMKITKS